MGEIVLHQPSSGIPPIEAVLNEALPQAPFHIRPKFVAGVLAIGSGLALRRKDREIPAASCPPPRPAKTL